MKPFQAPVDDILFTLNHVVNAARSDEYDADLTAELAGHFASFAEGVIAPIDEPGDREGCALVDGRVKMPRAYIEAYQAFVEGGWNSMTAPEEFGGQGLGGIIGGVISEIEAGASHAMQMLTNLVPGHIRTLMTFGTEDQKARFIPKLADGTWLGTMALTEPGAGSDLARVRTKAVKVGDLYEITGEKIFISGGDQDMSEGVFHLVLARTGELEDGIKGLSLFACLSALDDGSRNPIRVTRIEEKMGLHASPTCQLEFAGAIGELIGAEGEGLKAMFTLMNHARIDVALQSTAHSARAADIAKAYAAERSQGRGPDGRAITIDQHGDVARMLDELDITQHSTRAMTYQALVELEAGDNPWLLEFLTPVIKVFCSTAVLRAAETAMQVLGGYGYLEEYRVSQIYRDARIIGIYEGANGIHAMALAGRLSRLKDGAAFDAFARFVEEGPQTEGLARCYGAWQEARAHLLACSDIGPLAMTFMTLTGRTLEQAMWARIAAGADGHSAPENLRRLAVKVEKTAPRAEADLAELLA